VAWHPDKLRRIEVRHAFPRSPDQRQQARDTRLIGAGDITDSDIAVTPEQDLPRSRGQRKIYRQAQGQKFGLVVATVPAGQDGLFTAATVWRQQHNAKAELSRIGQRRTIKPGLPGCVDRQT
jgi:hypothetical protein